MSKYLGRVNNVRLDLGYIIDVVDVVAVSGAVGDWAAYAGQSDETDEWIHGNGQKLRESEAARLFPYLNAKHYRR